MEKHITLMGTEQIQNAANIMRSAAEQMGRAGSNMHDTLERHQRWMDDWLSRFQAILEAREKSP